MDGVETRGGTDHLRVGQQLPVRARVHLGALSPDVFSQAMGAVVLTSGG